MIWFAATGRFTGMAAHPHRTVCWCCLQSAAQRCQRATGLSMPSVSGHAGIQAQVLGYSVCWAWPSTNSVCLQNIVTKKRSSLSHLPPLNLMTPSPHTGLHGDAQCWSHASNILEGSTCSVHVCVQPAAHREGGVQQTCEGHANFCVQATACKGALHTKSFSIPCPLTWSASRSLHCVSLRFISASGLEAT